MSTETVLVVDDNLLMRDTITMLLAAEGFIVQNCDSGESALDRVREYHFGIFLIDYKMPGMNGCELTAVLRARYPAVIIVGFSLEQKEQEFLEAGADRFLSKDYMYERLVQTIRGQ